MKFMQNINQFCFQHSVSEVIKKMNFKILKEKNWIGIFCSKFGMKTKWKISKKMKY